MRSCSNLNWWWWSRPLIWLEGKPNQVQSPSSSSSWRWALLVFESNLRHHHSFDRDCYGRLIHSFIDTNKYTVNFVGLLTLSVTLKPCFKLSNANSFHHQIEKVLSPIQHSIVLHCVCYVLPLNWKLTAKNTKKNFRKKNLIIASKAIHYLQLNNNNDDG